MDGSGDETASKAAIDEAKIAEMVALLNEEQRQRFSTLVNNQIDLNGAVSDQFRLDVADTLLSPIAERDQNRQINDNRRDEDHRAAREFLLPIEQTAQEPITVTQDSAAQQPDPTQGIEAHRPNYAELRETHEQVAAQEATSATEQRAGTIAQGEPQNEARAYGDEIWMNALDRYEGLSASLAEQDEQTSAELRQIAPETQQQSAADPLQPVEIQDHGPAETHTGKVDGIAEFLNAESLDRESRRAALQQLGQAAGREITEQEGKEIGRDFGGGMSL
jgi:hypothetical protein